MVAKITHVELDVRKHLFYRSKGGRFYEGKPSELWLVVSLLSLLVSPTIYIFRAEGSLQNSLQNFPSRPALCFVMCMSPSCSLLEGVSTVAPSWLYSRADAPSFAAKSTSFHTEATERNACRYGSPRNSIGSNTIGSNLGSNMGSFMGSTYPLWLSASKKSTSDRSIEAIVFS